VCRGNEIGIQHTLYQQYIYPNDRGNETHHKIKIVGGVFNWAEDHNCKFGLDKFQLVDFSLRREREYEGQC
jgi:hypothetical protein